MSADEVEGVLYPLGRVLHDKKRGGERWHQEKAEEPRRSTFGMEPGTDDPDGERAPLHGEEYYRHLIEKSFDLIIVVNAKGETTYVSPNAEQLIGYRPDEVLGVNTFGYIHPDDAPGVIGFFFNCVEKKGFSNYLFFRVRDRWDPWRYFEAVGNNLLGDAQVEGVIVDARDITDRKLLENRLREIQDSYRKIIDSANDAMFIHDMRTGELLYANHMMTEMYGYSLEEARDIGLEAFGAGEPPIPWIT
ncbi:MAG: PAS domain S-box protein [Actinomycetota bacterium]|nr:PAS domain S-box protein [Actinomycetota bacterium]